MLIEDDVVTSYFGLDCSLRTDGQYELYFSDGTTRFATTAEIVQARKNMLQNQAYRIAAQKLNAQSADYGDPEKSTWGLLQMEVQTYNTTGAVGPVLQKAVDNTLGIHTVATLAAKLTAWAQYQDAVIQARAAHVKAINAPTDLTNYDVNTGWP